MGTLRQSQDSPMMMAYYQKMSQRSIIRNQMHYEHFWYETGPASGTLQKSYATEPKDWYGSK